MTLSLESRLLQLEQQLNDLLSFGKIVAVDTKRARVQVDHLGRRSAWLPWLTQRAGGDRTWWAPNIGEQVLVLAPSGITQSAVVLPAIYQASLPAPASEASIHSTHYADGCIIEYNTKTHKLKVLLPSGGKVIIDGDVVIKRDLSVEGEVTSQGVSLAKHTHIDSKGGETTPPTPKLG